MLALMRLAGSAVSIPLRKFLRVTVAELIQRVNYSFHPSKEVFEVYPFPIAQS